MSNIYLLSAWAITLDPQTVIAVIALLGVVVAGILYFFGIRGKAVVETYRESGIGWRELAESRGEAKQDLTERVTALETEVKELHAQNEQLIRLNLALQAKQAQDSTTISSQAATIDQLSRDKTQLQIDIAQLRNSVVKVATAP